MTRSERNRTPSRELAWVELAVGTLLAAACNPRPAEKPTAAAPVDIAQDAQEARQRLASKRPKRCAEGGHFPVDATELNPASHTDYLAIRAYAATPGRGDPEQWTRVDFVVLSESGSPCNGARGEACLIKLGGHPTAPVAARCDTACIELSVVTTRGDEVRRWAALPELLQLLAPIDTGDEALLLAAAHGYRLSCDPGRTRVQAVAGGFEVTAYRTQASDGETASTSHLLLVTSDGSVEQLSEAALHTDSGNAR